MIFKHDLAQAEGEEKVKILGITGGIGAGKSKVLDYLQEHYGARVIQADLVAHHLQEPGKSCYRAIVDAFGGGILRADGTIDREILGKRVYANREELERLNRMVHPAVKAYIIEESAKEREKNEAPFVVIEAALLLEDHYDLICDEIWYVYAADEVRTERLVNFRGYTPEKVRNVLRNQKKDAEYRQECKLVIDNSGDFVENTVEQIDKGLVEHGFL